MNKATNDWMIRPILIGDSVLASNTPLESLPKGVIAVYREDLVRAAANVTVNATPFIYIAQGTGDPVLGAKKTMPIAPGRVRRWAGQRGVATQLPQISHIGWTGVAGDTVNTLAFDCDRAYSFQFRVISKYIDVYLPLGLNASIVHKTPCCDPCASGDCGNVDAEAEVDKIVAAINADKNLSEWVLAEKVSQGTAPNVQLGIRITGKTPPTFSNPGLPEAFAWSQDAVQFGIFFDNEQSIFDLGLPGDCSSFAVTVTQRPTYAQATGAEILELEKRQGSYLSAPAKYRSMDALTNTRPLTADPSALYDLYELAFLPITSYAFQHTDEMLEEVLIAIKTGQGSVLEDTLNSYFAGSTVRFTTDTVDLNP